MITMRVLKLIKRLSLFSHHLPVACEIAIRSLDLFIVRFFGLPLALCGVLPVEVGSRRHSSGIPLRPDHELLLLLRAFDLKFLDRFSQGGLLVRGMNDAVHSRRGSRDRDDLPRR
jgi:hypothetical protein